MLKEEEILAERRREDPKIRDESCDKKYPRLWEVFYSSIPPSTFYLIHHSMGTGIGYHLGNSLSYNKTTVQNRRA